ncbi:MAG: hypothetical protein IJS96_06860 [Schwartzia sp.]|nr:hypothetical protein [Schwartzia sp. (in: firmicutes)]
MANKEMSATEKMRQKIADKALDAEQMEDVAGGTYQEVDRDVMFLNMLLGNGTVQRDFFSPNNSTFSLEKAWSQVGVECKASNKSNVPNRYFVNGTEVQHTGGHTAEHLPEVRRQPPLRPLRDNARRQGSGGRFL